MEKELAIGIGFEGNCLTGSAVNNDGQIVTLPLKDFFRRGLPVPAKPIRRRIDTDFSHWRELPAHEYAEALGIALPLGYEINHQCFEIVQGTQRFVVPALALMRGLFRPPKYLLPAMFMPQALDQMCQLQKAGDSLFLEIDVIRATKYVTDHTLNLQPLIGWMYSYPSAFAMAGSIHLRAINGHIGLLLPQAHMRIVLHGHAVGRTLFVTDTTVVAITPSDEPTVQISEFPRVILLHNRVVTETGRTPERARQYVVPLNADGSVELSDAEWSDIEPLLVPVGRPSKWKLSPRKLLEGILTKLAKGTPWKKMDYPVGNWLNASALFQRLANRKKLDVILMILSESRTRPAL